MRPFHSIAVAALLSLPFAAGPVPAFAAEPDGPEKLVGHEEAIRIAIQEQLSAKFTSTTETHKQEQGALVEFYSLPEHETLWVDEDGLTKKGKAIVAELRKADEYGLRSADYAVPDLSDFKPASFKANPGKAAKRLADAEINISYAVMRYANDARGGRIKPARLSGYLDPELRLPKPLEVIESISFRSDPAAYMRSFQPDQPQFEALRRKLAELRAEDGVEEEVVAEQIVLPAGPTLRRGMKHSQVALLRKRLDVEAIAAIGDGAPASDPEIFDGAVDEAVRQFQREHGLTPDGLVGPGTRRVMNGGGVPAITGNDAKIRLILANMERWRWLPNDLGDFYVRVNIPEFKLRVVEDRKVIHTARAVVGKPSKQTPVFSDQMETVVFNPSWHVPNSIKTEEIRPYIRRTGGWFQSSSWDTRVLDRHNLRVNYNGNTNPQSIDWDRVDVRKIAFTQPPGPSNVLGVVKFLFPNKHDVYMHDTPQRFLFNKQIRAESHGCMRIQNPDQLAEVVLNHDQNWNMSQVRNRIANSYDQGIALKTKIPVYITYFTAWVNADGSMSTYGDIYGHDARMERALNL
ncbi:L,D-transpeptidase family protein [Methyloligella sp. 2.7D]|uniref:L,D-transpeptidase family protein n=1 Tax=unclassified Methyloligella TaxID=2625955 RepID=UPI00157CF5A0|nr:L,D-transpeptidase family protein [Methyloligella sp. GL2]QKP76784.1 L,D-transpeptidase family protein [Methyloligella sp. GL2]